MRVKNYEKIKLSFFIPFTAGDVALLVIGVLLTFTSSSMMGLCHLLLDFNSKYYFFI